MKNFRKISLWRDQQYNGFLNLSLAISTLLVLVTLYIFGKRMFLRTFFSPTANGDERKYYVDLLFANAEGLKEAINKGTSITFLSSSYILDSWLHSPLFSIRLISFFSGILIIISFLILGKKLLKKNSLLLFQITLSLLYTLIIQLTLFIGYNDLLMHFLGFLFLTTYLLPVRNKTIQFIVLGLLFAAILATRKMAVIYLFVFVLLFTIQLWKYSSQNRSRFSQLLIFTISFFLFFMLFNLSSILSDSGLSFDDKILTGPVNWAQWEYHNAMLIDLGEQDRFHHVNIAETQKYLAEHGPTALPSTFLEMIIFNPALTLKEFFLDFFIGIKYFIRQTGLWPFVFIYFFIRRLKKIRNPSNFTPTDFIYFFSLMYFLLICLVVITNLQMRWFTFFIPIMFLLLGRDLNKKSKVEQKLFFTFNNILLFVMFLPYLIRHYF